MIDQTNACISAYMIYLYLGCMGLLLCARKFFHLYFIPYKIHQKYSRSSAILFLFVKNLLIDKLTNKHRLSTYGVIGN